MSAENRSVRIENRIITNDRCEYIQIDDHELDAYRGAGLMLCHFVDGILVALFDPLDVSGTASDDFDEASQAAIKASLDWCREKAEVPHSEVWIALASCFQLVNPLRIDLADAGSVAHLASRIGDAL